MINRILQSMIFVLLASASLMAQVSVSGTITSSDGDPLIGVNVIEEGTINGTVSDLDGNYTLAVEGPESTLRFSYTGYTNQSVIVGSQTNIDLVMQEGVQIDEVVVTALGISRDKKSITYAAQNAEVGSLTEARPTNLLEGLSGNVAGISVGRVGSGVSGAAKVVLRGNRSIAGSSQPLYVVDGVTLGGDISNLSADDIESITVLKGANAAALYGSRANNGVIIVNTKMGRGEGYAIDFNTSYMAQQPIFLNDFQNEYGQGSDGVFSPNGERSWGPRLDGSQKPHWSNDPNWPAATAPYQANPTGRTSDFFKTGHNFSTNLGISTNTENTRSYFSYTYTDAEGVVPMNTLKSHNLNVRMNTKLLDRLTLDTKVNYIRRNLDNVLRTGGSYENEVRALYKQPANIQTEDVSVYEFTDNEGVNRHHFWQPGLNAPSNAYWMLNNVTNDVLEERVIGLISLKYDFNENFSLLGRSSIDRTNSQRKDRYSTESFIIADNGFYQTRNANGFEWNSDFLLNYKQDFSADFTLDVSAGGAVRRNEGGAITGNSSGRNSPLNVPNLFSFGNTSNITVAETFSRREVQSLYAFATLGFKNAIFVDITGRNDWSSTLKAENRSFFYPSAGVTVVASDLMASTPSWLSLLKFRASYAEVGNDTAPFQTVRAANVRPGGSGSVLQLATTIPIDNLLPETTRSLEFGADIRLFQNRLGLDLTYYKSNTTDQLFRSNLPIASGATSIFLNGADVQNTGFEAVVTAGIMRSDNFSWDVTLNYSANDSEVLEIADGFDQLNIGGANFLRQFKLEVGEPWGNVYSRGFERDDQGRVIVEADGTPRVTSGLDALVSNFNPDFLAGIRNSFSYRNLSLSFLIDIRQGGSIVSNTNAIMWADGATAATLQGREGGLVFGDNFFSGETAVQEDGTPNTVSTNAEKMWTKLGGRNSPVGEAFILDASNVRLRELVVGYSLPSTAFGNSPFRSAKISVVGRNLFFFSNAAGNVDPEVFTGTGLNVEGTEDFGPPTSREFGVNLKFGF